MAHDIDPSEAAFGKGEPILRDIAAGRLTVVDNPDEAARDLGIAAEAMGGREHLAEMFRHHMPVEVAEDRRLARRLLRALGEDR